MEDREILKKAQKGDHDAFSALYKRYLPQIYRFIFLKTGERELSEDLASQVFLQAWRNIRRFKIRKNPFSSWLYQIARNLVIDFYRANRSIYSLDGKTVIESYDGTEDKIDRDGQREILNKVIKELPEIQQTVVILRFIEELSDAEISKIIKKREGTVRVIQHRAIQTLKEKINGRDIKKFKEA